MNKWFEKYFKKFFSKTKLSNNLKALKKKFKFEKKKILSFFLVYLDHLKQLKFFNTIFIKLFFKSYNGRLFL